MTDLAENLPLPASSEETGNDVGPGKPPVEYRFQKGQSGNPKGRPKGLASATRDVLKQAVADGEDPALALARFAASVMGDETAKMEHRLEALRWLGDRGWGKAPQFAPMEGDDPLQFDEDQAREIAVSFEKRLDELAERRKQREPAAAG